MSLLSDLIRFLTSIKTFCILCSSLILCQPKQTLWRAVIRNVSDLFNKTFARLKKALLFLSCAYSNNLVNFLLTYFIEFPFCPIWWFVRAATVFLVISFAKYTGCIVFVTSQLNSLLLGRLLNGLISLKLLYISLSKFSNFIWPYDEFRVDVFSPLTFPACVSIGDHRGGRGRGDELLNFGVIIPQIRSPRFRILTAFYFLDCFFWVIFTTFFGFCWYSLLKIVFLYPFYILTWFHNSLATRFPRNWVLGFFLSSIILFRQACCPWM